MIRIRFKGYDLSPQRLAGTPVPAQSKSTFYPDAMMLLLALCALALAAPPVAPAQQADPEIRRTVDRMFDAMRSRDTAALRAVFDTGARLMTTATSREGKPVLRVTPIDRFIQSIGAAPAGTKLDERIFDVEVRQSDYLATVWARYAFYAGEQFSHCGYDAFHLFKSEQGWRIIAIADTQRREGCAP
jgi:hypothetical protein